MQKEKMQSKMILQVHDELVFDALKTEAKELKPLDIGKHAGCTIVTTCSSGNSRMW